VAWVEWAPTTSSTTALSHTIGVLPCVKLCYGGGYFAGHSTQLLVESLSDGRHDPVPAPAPSWARTSPGSAPPTSAGGATSRPRTRTGDSLDPLAQGGDHALRHQREPEPQYVHDGRGTWGQTLTGRGRAAARGQSGFIAADGTPSPHLCDQVSLFNDFRYKGHAPGPSCPAIRTAPRSAGGNTFGLGPLGIGLGGGPPC